VITKAQVIELDLSACHVDVLEIDRLAAEGIPQASTERLAAACDLVAGELLEGMQAESVELAAWLVAQRQRYSSMHVAMLRELTARMPPGSDGLFRRLEAWLRHEPFEARAHQLMFDALVKSGRLREAEAHVNATIRAFEQEGVDWAPLRDAWHAIRHKAGSASVVTVECKAQPLLQPQPARRGSVVVMPFADATPGARQLADGLTDDIITRLAKLRVFFVIARGTSYALRDRGVDPREAGRLLEVEYVVSGVVRRHGERLSVLVELAQSSSAHIVWADEIEGVANETFSVLDSIVARVVAGISEEIEREECKRAILKPPSSLDAWEAYHRGLWHMYRFTGPDNEISARFFGEALALDPTFARAYAGLSFTHFQNVFLGLTNDRDRQLALALSTAGQSLSVDDRDPAAHWALGRALWLKGEQAESVAELERSVELSPNFALGHYTLGFVRAQSGDPKAAIEAADYSRKLSPFDPLQFGMLGSRALAHMRLGERDAAAEWALRAANRPNAHVHILAIAAANLALAQRREQARELVARIRTQVPNYTVEDFLRAFRFLPDAEHLFRESARSIGFD
jgi:TolB-like protein